MLQIWALCAIFEWFIYRVMGLVFAETTAASVSASVTSFVFWPLIAYWLFLLVIESKGRISTLTWTAPTIPVGIKRKVSINPGENNCNFELSFHHNHINCRKRNENLCQFQGESCQG
jgi:hypothetical protein